MDNRPKKFAGSIQTARDLLSDDRSGALRKYRYLTSGDHGWGRFLYQEMITFLCGSVGGALGLWLRKKLYPPMFGKFGRNVIIGRNVTLRHPSKIRIGDNVVIDEGALLDARGAGETGLLIGDRVMINRGVSIQSKGGDILIEDDVSIGSDSQIMSWSGVFIGQGAAIAGGCYFSAGTYRLTDFDTPLKEREAFSKGPIKIGRNVWIATRATILDGVVIGDNAIVSAGSVVSQAVDEKCIVQGDPAKIVFRGR